MSIRKIVVGTDFSEYAEVAIRQALDIARHHDAELVLAHASFILPHGSASVVATPNSVSERIESARKAQLAIARDKLGEIRERLDGQGATISHMVVDMYPDVGIPQIANELSADLTVIGTHGRTGFRRFLMGSIAERVVRLSTGRVLVARPNVQSAGGYKRILIPTDFSRYAQPCLHTAISLAAKEASIHLLHLWNLPSVAWAEDAWDTHGALPSRHELIENAVREGEALIAGSDKHSGVSLTFYHREARPAVGIHQQLEEGDYDLVVMGSHGHRGVKRWLLGSVAESTVRHAPCSVVVVHLPSEAAR